MLADGRGALWLTKDSNKHSHQIGAASASVSARDRVRTMPVGLRVTTRSGAENVTPLASTHSEEMQPVRVWDVVVQPDRVWARTAEEARAIFVKAITADPELMYVAEAKEDVDVD